MSAQITMSYQEFQDLQRKISSQEAEIGALRVDLEAARVGDEHDDRSRLAKALCEALIIVQFALAERNPLAFRGWPHEALRRLGELLHADCPGVPETFRSSALQTFALYADEAKKWEDARAAGVEQELLAEENAARAVGPDHPIFGLGRAAAPE